MSSDKESKKSQRIVIFGKDDNPDDYLKPKDATNDKLKEAWAELRRESYMPYGYQFNDDGTNHPIEPQKVYKPTEKISDEDWKAMKEHYLREFDGFGIEVGMIKEHLNSLWEWWNKGAYPSIDKFVDTLDTQFQRFADLLKERQKKSFLDESLFHDLNGKWSNLANQLRWDGSIADGILKDEVIEVETDIYMFFKKRIEHGLEITDEMREFKGLAELPNS